MSNFYSKSTRGFYSSDVHKTMPGDAVEITPEQYRAMFAAQAEGKVISPDENGYPIATDPAPADPKKKAVDDIQALEVKFLLPRAVREFMLGALSTEATKAGLDPMLLPAYVKLKALDDQIYELRKQL